MIPFVWGIIRKWNLVSFKAWLQGEEEEWRARGVFGQSEDDAHAVLHFLSIVEQRSSFQTRKCNCLNLRTSYQMDYLVLWIKCHLVLYNIFAAVCKLSTVLLGLGVFNAVYV